VKRGRAELTCFFCFVYNASVELPLEVKVAAHEPPVEPTHTVYNIAELEREGN